MKFSVLVALFGLVVAVVGIQVKKATKHRDYSKVDVTDDPEQDYQNFLAEFNPDYTPDENHHERLAAFHKCRQDTIDHDADGEGYSKGLTKFCHMTSAEVANQWNHHIGLPRPKSNEATFEYTERDLENARASNVDWRTQGLVSSVKDQGQCGSCYTFAAAAALEGQWMKAHGALYNGSTQQYVDCSSSYGNEGCNGGLPAYCYKYTKATGKELRWECYPYSQNTYSRGAVGTCQASMSCTNTMTVTGYVSIANENGILAAIGTVGPIAVGIDATPLQTYTGGIINPSKCSTYANHAVTVVGLGTASGQQYWIVKNSWGASWGENGYFRMPVGVNACGIGTNGPVYPTVV